jgi:hypothetical protein
VNNLEQTTDKNSYQNFPYAPKEQLKQLSKEVSLIEMKQLAKFLENQQNQINASLKKQRQQKEMSFWQKIKVCFTGMNNKTQLNNNNKENNLTI